MKHEASNSRSNYALRLYVTFGVSKYAEELFCNNFGENYHRNKSSIILTLKHPTLIKNTLNYMKGFSMFPSTKRLYSLNFLKSDIFTKSFKRHSLYHCNALFPMEHRGSIGFFLIC